VKNDRKIYKTNLNLGYGLLHFVGVVFENAWKAW
jgi:hypothetical protein